MGCDIHIEVFARCRDRWLRVARPPLWLLNGPQADEFDLKYSYWPSRRNYKVFGKLCDGIRGYCGNFPARGLPDFLDLTDPPADSLDLGDHSHSWLSLEELQSINWTFHDPEGENYTAWPQTELIPLLEQIKALKDVQDVIIVFGFDS